ncbi:hypothetical protein FACS1894162_3860 [Bacteroidia bacterium]|nr:hypothetical protein FACS1894162_3860 [Bacteroidia bacterium]
MKFEKEFKEWLEKYRYPDSKPTVGSRIANCKNVEKNYGDLGTHFDKDKCGRIVSELTYSKADEREKRKPNHPIHIDGNIYNGSATLKQAVGLYVQFRNLLSDVDEQSDYLPEKTFASKYEKAKETLIKALNEFSYSYVKHKDIVSLQLDIEEHLMTQLPEFDWTREFSPSESYKDSVDIFGTSKKEDLKIIIELDAHQADQLAKKFVSRFALFLEENIIYVSLLYRGTEKMPINECKKYFKYCDTISKWVEEKTGIAKIYIGKLLEEK